MRITFIGGEVNTNKGVPPLAGNYEQGANPLYGPLKFDDEGVL
jgi:hypothetical protein